MSFTQNTAAQSRALTAFFDTKGAAQQAVSDIEAAGVPRHDVTMVEGGAGTAGVASASTHEGFLASLKDMLMPEEDRYSYAEGLRRGGYSRVGEGRAGRHGTPARHPRPRRRRRHGPARDVLAGEGWTGYRARGTRREAPSRFGDAPRSRAQRTR